MPLPEFPKNDNKDQLKKEDNSNMSRKNMQLALVFPLPRNLILDYSSRSTFMFQLVNLIRECNYYAFDYVINQEIAIFEIRLINNESEFDHLDRTRQMLLTMDLIVEGIQPLGIDGSQNYIIEQLV